MDDKELLAWAEAHAASGSSVAQAVLRILTERGVVAVEPEVLALNSIPSWRIEKLSSSGVFGKGKLYRVRIGKGIFCHGATLAEAVKLAVEKSTGTKGGVQ